MSALACTLEAQGASDPVFTPPGVGYTLLAPSPLPTELLPTATPVPSTPTPPIPPTAASTLTEAPPVLYWTQPGDTLSAVAVRFGVSPEEVRSPEALPESGFLPPQQVLLIPKRFANTTSSLHLLPDSEIIFGPSAVDFDVEAYVRDAGGYLNGYREYLASSGWTSGAQVVARVALENSINPRLLLALLEYQGGWVFGQPVDSLHADCPLGHVDDLHPGSLYFQLVWAVNRLSTGYYGWREGLLTELTFSDGVTVRLAPELNAGTVALQYYLAQVYDTPGWITALDIANGVPGLHEKMFGSPWLRDQAMGPIFPADLAQPKMVLPFFFGQLWSYTGGPHGAWEMDGARAAVDFAPAGDVSDCDIETTTWALAAAPGLVTRAGHGVLVIDLDNDGHEQTGWVLLYLHLSEIQYRVGDEVETGDLLGRPSCEGGLATGPHIHLARKYNGEWMPADGPVPFVLSGWTVHAGAKPYEGTLTRDGEIVTASVYGSFESRILRTHDEP